MAIPVEPARADALQKRVSDDSDRVCGVGGVAGPRRRSDSAVLLARQEGLNATAAFATILVERILDLVAVLLLLLAFLIWFDPGVEARDSALFSAIRFGGLVMAPVAVGALLLMFFMAGHPERLHGVAFESGSGAPG